MCVVCETHLTEFFGKQVHDVYIKLAFMYKKVKNTQYLLIKSLDNNLSTYYFLAFSPLRQEFMLLIGETYSIATPKNIYSADYYFKFYIFYNSR